MARIYAFARRPPASTDTQGPKEPLSLDETSKVQRFEMFFAAHLDAAYNFARWLTRDERNAEDVAQEAFLRAFRFLDSFEGENGRAWLLGIVRNTYYTWLKRNQVSARSIPFDEASFDAGAYGDAGDDGSSVEGRLEEKDAKRVVDAALELERHLDSCDACRTEVARFSALRKGIGTHATYHRAPAGLAQRIRAQVAGSRAAPQAPRRRQWWPTGSLIAARPQWLQLGAAIAATALVTWTAALHFAGPAGDELTAERVIAGHARSVVTGHLADVASSDQHSVKPWLSGRLDFSLPVVDLTGSGFPLVGGRLDYLDERTVAALVYRHREHMINLFVWPL